MEESTTTIHTETPITSSTNMPPTHQKSHQNTKIAKPRSFSLQSAVIPLLIAFMLISGFLVHQVTVLDQKNSELDSRLVVLEKPNKYVSEQIEKDKFQAVFLSNGQVYFGKVTHIDGGTLTLKDIYYLKSGNFKQDGSVTGALSLAKLGKDEVHGPEDTMNIERQNVEFWENLKNESQVVKAIVAFEKKK